MAIEGPEANIILNPEGRLLPRAFDLTTTGDCPPQITVETVSILVGTDGEAVDVLRDWESDVPDHYKPIKLKVKERKKLQRQRLFLRNRRIVSGYELLDRQLRAKLGGGDPDAVPPTWLTVGKWTAKTIGDLLDGSIPISRRRRRTRRRVVRFFLRLTSRWRTLAMSRVLILGNREIFAQVASALVIFTEKNFDELKLDFPAFVGKYGEYLLGQGDPHIADELLFPISATTRDPLSDSMLRALYSYYKAIGLSSEQEQERTAWVVTGNLHLAAYEQHVAQTFVDLGLRLRSGRALRKLLAGFKPRDATRAGPVRNRPLDMLMEDMFGIRLMDLAVAAFASNYILSIQIGPVHEHDVESGQVFAPTDPLDQVEDAVKSLMTLADTIEREAGESLRHIWVALDRADGHPDRCRVRDWRNYNSRISYIANLFAVSVHDPMVFSQPVLPEDELRNFLAGRLSNEEEGIELTPTQREAYRVVLENAKKLPSDLATAE